MVCLVCLVYEDAVHSAHPGSETLQLWPDPFDQGTEVLFRLSVAKGQVDSDFTNPSCISAFIEHRHLELEFPPNEIRCVIERVCDTGMKQRMKDSDAVTHRSSKFLKIGKVNETGSIFCRGKKTHANYETILFANICSIL